MYIFSSYSGRWQMDPLRHKVRTAVTVRVCEDAATYHQMIMYRTLVVHVSVLALRRTGPKRLVQEPELRRWRVRVVLDLPDEDIRALMMRIIRSDWEGRPSRVSVDVGGSSSQSVEPVCSPEGGWD